MQIYKEYVNAPYEFIATIDEFISLDEFEP